MIRLSVSRPQRLLTGTALAVAILLSACNKNRGDDYDLAKESMAKAETPTAIIHLKAALQKEPNRWEARTLLGYALMRTGDAVGATVELEKANAAQFNPDEVVPALASAILQTGKPQVVIERFGKLKMQTPAATAALQATLGIAHWQTGNKAEAEAAVARALEAAPMQSNALMLKATIAAAQGDVDGAIGLMNWLLQRNPKDLQATLMLASLQDSGKSDPAAAEKTLLKALEIEPRFVEAHKALILLKLRARDNVAANERLKQLIKVAPRHSSTLYATALTAYTSGDTKRAREAMEQLLRTFGGSGDLQALAGHIEAQAGSLIKAESHLGKAVQLLPDRPAVRIALTDVYVRSGQYERALETLTPLLEQATPPIEAIASAAQVNTLLGNLSRAEKQFQLAAKLAPESNRLKAALATLKFKRGETQDSIHDLEAIAKPDNKSSDSYAALALALAKMRIKDYDGAIAAAHVASQATPNDALPGIIKASAYEQKGDVAGARTALEQAVKADPSHFRANVRLAEYDAHAKNWLAAIQRMEALAKASPSDPKPILALLDFKRSSGATPESLISSLEASIADMPTEPSLRTRLVAEKLAAGQISSALSAAQTAAAAFPDQAQVLTALATAQRKAGNTAQALASLHKVVGLRPKDPSAQYRLAEVLLEAGNANEAISALRKAIEIDAGYLPAYRAMAAISARSGDFKTASATAKRLQKAAPNEDLGYLLEGDLAAKQKQWPAASEAYQNALQRRSSSEVAIKLHTSLTESGKVEAATTFSSNWRKANPKDGEFRQYLADRLIERRKYEAATEILLEATRVAPQRAEAWSSLAFSLAELKKPGAVDAANKAIQIDGKRAAFHGALAKALAAQGSLEQAIKAQRDSVTLASRKAPYRLALAKLLTQAGDAKAARAELQELARDQSEKTIQAEAIELLKAR